MKRILSITASLLIASSTAFATPGNRKAFEKYFGPLLSENLKSCSVCHVRDEPEGAESLDDFPHNPFGKSLAALDGKIIDRFDKVFATGDDLDKILVGIRPIQQGKVIDSTLLNQRKEEFAIFHDRYPWRPFEQVKRPDVPAEGEGWAKSKIDNFIAAEHAQRGLSPRPEASPEIWLRRVTVDLTGLVPTVEEIRAFQRNPDYEAKVEELLASPRYGERWGRHFMDIWRYADWTGYKGVVRESARHIWNWRDWIVESFNGDKGYDQMIVEMLAADELYPGDYEKIRATGYLARNYHSDRNQSMDMVVTHTSQAFLGITLGCAKCHDHMYDPFPQTDYFAMRAIFEAYRVRTDRVPGTLDVKEDGIPRVYDVTLKPKTLLLDRGDERFPLRDHPVEPGVPAALGGDFAVKRVAIPEVAADPWRREFVKEGLMAKCDSEFQTAEKALEDLAEDATPEAKKAAEFQLASMKLNRTALLLEFAVEALEPDAKEHEKKAKELFQVQAEAAKAEADWKIAAAANDTVKATTELAAAKKAKDTKATTAATAKLTQAKKDKAAAGKLLTAAEKKLKEEVTTEYTPRDTDYLERSNGRRIAFVNWLADKQNPLTARVAANHIWMRHFEFGLVPTVNDFGANGREPTHPALLDWLAAELMELDWSLKKFHKEIVLSATYRMESTPSPANLAVDPDNHFLWRMPTRRMEGEIVRDNLLWVANRLDPTMGGPDIPNDQAQSSTRRSIYLTHAHERLVEFVQIFDGPKVSECYSREESIQPHQALAMHNSPLTKNAAVDLAKQLQSDDSESLVAESFLRLIGRPPTDDEKKLCLEFLNENSSDPAHDRERLVTVLLNHHEFVTVR